MTNGVDGIELGMNEIASCGGAGRAALPSRVSRSPRLVALGDEGPTPVEDDDIARGWRVWEVRTNSAVDYAMPEGAVMASNWWVRGAYEDCSIFAGFGDDTPRLVFDIILMFGRWESCCSRSGVRGTGSNCG